MPTLAKRTNTLEEIVSVVQRLDNRAQSAVLNNLRKFEITLKAKFLDASVKKGDKPSVEEIASSIRKTRISRAKTKVR